LELKGYQPEIAGTPPDDTRLAQPVLNLRPGIPNPDKPEPKRESCRIGRGPKAPYTSQRLENERSKSFLKKWQLSLTNIVAREQNHMNAK
jgi:hypothetical protein